MSPLKILSIAQKACGCDAVMASRPNEQQLSWWAGRGAGWRHRAPAASLERVRRCGMADMALIVVSPALF